MRVYYLSVYVCARERESVCADSARETCVINQSGRAPGTSLGGWGSGSKRSGLLG